MLLPKSYLLQILIAKTFLQTGLPKSCYQNPAFFHSQYYEGFLQTGLHKSCYQNPTFFQSQYQEVFLQTETYK